MSYDGDFIETVLRDRVTCPYCAGESDCAAVYGDERDPQAMCTREEGHAGPHVACSFLGQHIVETWV